MPSGRSDSSTERFSGWDIIPTQVPNVDSDQTLLSQLAGTWTEADEMDFLQNIEAFRAVEESLWS
jgi:hypothetical protein